MPEEGAGDWPSIDAILQAALERPVSERGDCIRRASKQSQQLQRELKHLLRASEEAARSGFLDDSAVDLLEVSTQVAPAHSAGDLGAYRLVRELGRGGMGVVYLARRVDGEFQHQVAIKFVRRGLSKSAADHLSRERQILARLQHPNVARLLGGGSDDRGRPYFIMEYVDGRPIDVYCDAGNLTVTQRLRLFLQVARAVRFAHQHAIVHGDLKPRNLFVTGDGTVKLLDFGTAHVLEAQARGDRAARTGRSRALTLAYASPEQLFGRPISVSTDVFSLGAILHLLLVGVTPRSGEQNEPLIFRQTAEANPPSTTFSILRASCEPGSPVVAVALALKRGLSARRLERALEGDLDAILLKALQSDPAKRYASVEQLAGEVERYLEGRPVSARRAGVLYRASKLVRRNPISTFFSLALTLSLFGALSFLAVQTHRLQLEMEVAERQRAKAEHLSDFLVDVFQLAGSGGQRPSADLLHQGVERARQEFGERPIELATALTALGSAYRSMARYDTARALLEEGLEIRLDRLGPDHPDTASSLHEVGYLDWARMELDEAEISLRRALSIREGHFGVDSAPVASTLLSLSNVALARGEVGQAESLAAEALKIQLRTLGVMHEETARGLHNLAGIQSRRGATTGVERRMLTALEIRRRLLGPSHPDVGATLNNLGYFYSQSGRMLDARDSLTEAAEIYRRAWGPRHPYLATTLRNLVAVRAALAEYRLAEPLAREVVEILQAIHGAEHLEVAFAWHDLGLLALRQGKSEQATGLFEKSVELAKSSGGPDHEYVICGIQHLGEAAHQLGEVERAAQLFDGALEMWRDTTGLEQQHAASTLHAKAALLLDMGRVQEARALMERALEVRVEILGREHADVAHSLHDLADLELEGGNPAKAARLCEEALAIRQTRLGTGHPAAEASADLCGRTTLAAGS